MSCINAGDVEGLLALYTEDAVQVGFDRTIVGRDALRPVVERWLAGRPQVRELAYAEGPDLIAFEATDGRMRAPRPRGGPHRPRGVRRAAGRAGGRAARREPRDRARALSRLGAAAGA